MQNFRNLGQPLLVEKYVSQKKERKNAKNSGHYVLPAMPKAAHTLHSDQNVYSATPYYFNVNVCTVVTSQLSLNTKT